MSDNGLECANGNFVDTWNGCVDQGSVRIRCPKKQFPCNDIGGNGEFRCRKDCTEYGGLRNCLTKGIFIPKLILIWYSAVFDYNKEQL